MAKTKTIVKMKTLKLQLLAFMMMSLGLMSQTVHHPMAMVNKQWLNHPNALEQVPVTVDNLSDKEIIRQHLNWVHHFLTLQHTEGLNEVQRANREQSLVELKAYADRGLFPVNEHLPIRNPVFIDNYGTHCAVGYLIKQSGYSALGQKVKAEYNLSYLHDIKTQGLAAWQAQSGFTVDELAWIQPTYPAVSNVSPMGNGSNGPVMALATEMSGGIIIGGNFDTAGVAPAGNLAQWIAGFAGFLWNPLGNVGVNGRVHDILFHKGKMYVAGDFYMADTVPVNSGVAVYENGQWTAMGQFYVGALHNTVYDLQVYRDTIYAGGFFKAKAGVAKYFESIAKWNGTEWVHAGLDLLGGVSAMTVHNNKLVVAGSFSYNGGYSSQNIVKINGQTMEPFNDTLDVRVHAVVSHNGELFVGTDYSAPGTSDTIGLGVYRSNKWESLIVKGTINEEAEVRCLLSHQNKIIMGGDFNIMPMLVGKYGENLAYWEAGSITPMAVLDSTVNSMLIVQNALYLGGNFKEAFGLGGPTTLNHVAVMNLNFFGTHDYDTPSLKLYPNPAKDKVTIEGTVNSVQLFDMAGKEHFVSVKPGDDSSEVYFNKVPNGQYILSATTQNGTSSQTIMINQ